jgi:K+-transporting ATPase KdpF subunit
MGGSGTNGWWFRAEKPHGRVRGCSKFDLARRCFLAPVPDEGTRGMAAPARHNMPRTEEGRKGATEGRKESVNDRRGTRDLGLASVWSSTPRAPRMLARMRPGDRNSSEWRRDGCLGVHRAHGVDLRRARPCAEVGRRTVSYENIVGLVLSVLTALYLLGALLFPERF